MWLPPEFAPAYQHFTLYSGNFENSQVIQTLRRDCKYIWRLEKSGNAQSLLLLISWGWFPAVLMSSLGGFLNKRTQQRPSLQNDVKDWTKSTVANVWLSHRCNRGLKNSWSPQMIVRKEDLDMHLELKEFCCFALGSGERYHFSIFTPYNQWWLIFPLEAALMVFCDFVF